MSSTIPSRFPKQFAVKRADGYQLLRCHTSDEGRRSFVNIENDTHIGVHVMDYSQTLKITDSEYQYFGVDMNGRMVYYWPTGYDLVQNWGFANTEARFPILRFLYQTFPNKEFPLTYTPTYLTGRTPVIKDWEAIMSRSRTAAYKDYKSGNDTVMLEFHFVAPVVTAQLQQEDKMQEDEEDGCGCGHGCGGALEDEDDDSDSDYTPSLASDEMCYTEDDDSDSDCSEEEDRESCGCGGALEELTADNWWDNWRPAHYRRPLSTDLTGTEVYHPEDMLNWIRFTETFNARCALNGKDPIPIKFTIRDMERVNRHPWIYQEPVAALELLTYISKHIC